MTDANREQYKFKPSVSHRLLMQKEFAPVAWGIDGLVPQGVSLMAAAPKIGKSWFALQACHAKAAGRALWDGRNPETPGTALYIALEDNERRLQKRSRLCFPARRQVDDDGQVTWEAEPLDNLCFVTEWPRMGQYGIRHLNRWLTVHPECDLVVIDTLARFRPVRSGQVSYDEDYRVGEALKKVADEHAVAILLIHHTRKMDATDPFDTVSGTQGLTGSVDATLVLTRLRGSTDAGLYITGRDIENEIEMAIQFNKSECRWESSGVTVQEATLDQSRRQIIDVVRRANGPLTIKQIRSGLTEDGISKSADAVAKAVWRMCKGDQLERINGNQYTLSGVSEYA